MSAKDRREGGAASFQFVGQAHGGLVPASDALLVLDTQVVSALQSVGRRGFDLDRTTDRRVAHLLRWLAARPSAAFSPLFGIVEGAGFHAGGLSPYGLLQRALCAVAVVEYGRQKPEWIGSGEPLPEIEIPESAIHPRDTLEAAELLLPWTTLPCYVAGLATALADEQGLEPLEAADFVYRRLIAELDFIPTFAWFAVAALFLGRAGVRNELRHGLFKLQDQDKRRVCLSAGWDLGYLQLLSLARSPALRAFFEGRLPVLVTDDKHLGPTGVLSFCVGNSPLLELPTDLFDRRWREAAAELLQRRQLERLGAHGRPPTWEGCAEAAARLEAELGLDAPRLSLHRMTVVLESSPRDLLAFLGFLRVADAGTVVSEELDKCEEAEGAKRIAYLAHMVRDNARAHKRDVKASWAAIGERLPDGMAELPTFALLVKLVKAAMAQDWLMFNAWTEKLAVDRTDGIAMLGIWTLGRAVMEDTAAAYDETPEELLDRMIRRVTESDSCGEDRPEGSRSSS